MTRPTRAEINCTTGVETIYELTDEEIASRDASIAEEEAEREIVRARAEAKAAARLTAQTKLEALGLTAEEIAALN